MNFRRFCLLSPVCLIAFLLTWAGCSGPGPEAGKEGELKSTTTAGRTAPWLTNLGNLHRTVSTNSPDAQHFFDQGLTLCYAFNHMESVRSFKEAARLDPKCAMAYWGQALALGPNINDPKPGPEREQQAYEAIQKAQALKSGASEIEHALIDALAARYSDGKGKDRKELNQAYTKAMAKVYEKYPDDPDVGVLYAASIMNTMPWEYWGKDGKPRPGTKRLISVLESVIKRFPDHPGAHHYYIHAVEASPNPDLGVASADKLGQLVPGAGHLVHMPSHIYIRVGRYADATEANRRAIAADEDYITQCRAQGIYPVAYYPHNMHFMWTTLSMEGRSEEAIRTARQVASKVTDEMLHEEGYAFGHLLRAVPLFSLVRFGKWDEILKEPAPPSDSPFLEGISYYARGLAFIGKGDLKDASGEQEKLELVALDPGLEQMKIWELNSLGRLVKIANEVLAGELAAKHGDFKTAVVRLRSGVKMEDDLIYSEPPDWPHPVRHWLGAVLLEAGRPAEAEKVYREDLKRHRDNGWALFGLVQSLEAQGKTAEASKAQARFNEVWSRADVKLVASRF
jgi:tetratricopeptide (TPR) repeat protein